MRPLADLFWPKVTKTDGCWLWTGAKVPAGYGKIARTYNVSPSTIHRILSGHNWPHLTRDERREP